LVISQHHRLFFVAAPALPRSIHFTNCQGPWIDTEKVAWLDHAANGKMILATHAIVGGAIASLLPSHPALVAALGFASHFAIDAIPHWDYPLRAITINPDADNRRLKLDRALFSDLSLIGLDACAGLAITVWLFATSANIGAILIGAFAAMLPDSLQFAHSLHPHEPLKSVQRFHSWIHTKKKLSWPIGTSSQALFAAAVSGIALMVG
jgi:hypothetical protein